MKIPQPSQGGDFTPTPPGQYTAICCRVVDLGTQRSEGMYGVKYNRKVLLGWEIPEVRIEIDGKAVLFTTFSKSDADTLRDFEKGTPIEIICTKSGDGFGLESFSLIEDTEQEEGALV